MLLKKNILILVEEKKKCDSGFLSYNLMLNSGKKIRALDQKKKYSNYCVVQKKISERNKKP
jgi:hypothetical protein